MEHITSREVIRRELELAGRRVGLTYHYFVNIHTGRRCVRRHLRGETVIDDKTKIYDDPWKPWTDPENPRVNPHTIRLRKPGEQESLLDHLTFEDYNIAPWSVVEYELVGEHYKESPTEEPAIGEVPSHCSVVEQSKQDSVIPTTRKAEDWKAKHDGDPRNNAKARVGGDVDGGVSVTKQKVLERTMEALQTSCTPIR